ncbi:DUF7144 family membrane protein [Rhodococcus sp. NPDC054953]
MTTTRATVERPDHQGFAAGTSLGAAVLLLTVGVLSMCQGISAIAGDRHLVVGVDYTYALDVVAWGWIHLTLGVVQAISALGLMKGSMWGRVAAVTFVAVSLFTNFLWLPYYPAWAFAIIALDVVVIWAVTIWNPDGR